MTPKSREGRWFIYDDSTNDKLFGNYVYIIEHLGRGFDSEIFDLVEFFIQSTPMTVGFIREQGLNNLRHWIEYVPSNDDCQTAVQAIFGVLDEG
jgi:hypothetical protein